jgi:hypothetical protein
LARGVGVGEAATAEVAALICEFDRRKRLDIVRLKLPVEPRVERRDSGVGGGSWSTADASS